MSQPLITIIIVNYNVKDFLYQCLRSVEKASVDIDTEVIVVDNNSSDGSVPYLEPLFTNVDFISLKENIGFGRANNIGIAKAKGKYVLLLNPDTILNEQTLKIMTAYMDENPGTGISGCKILNPDGTFQLACRRGFPTPWASFSKLFGLQKLFPSSKLFAKYNQTFRSIDETYYVDAVMGAFMFCRKEVLQELKGFDPDFFMYGEDIDICYRAKLKGWNIAYVHTTSIIHYKGESTRRSPINELRHFYNAMAIFARKHYSYSGIFLAFLKLGIFLRSVISYLNKYRFEFALILTDLVIINLSLLISTKIRFGEYFRFPDYAYPTVFIVISIVQFAMMTLAGEYFESRHTVRKSFIALIMSFFFLSSLTYFFNEYAFSRGVLLMTIGFGIILTSAVRLGMIFIEKVAGKGADRRIAILGLNPLSDEIINSIKLSGLINANFIGKISTRPVEATVEDQYPIIGHIDYIDRVIKDYNIHEIIITDYGMSHKDLIRLVSESSGLEVRFHLVNEFDELIMARIIDDISGREPTVPNLNIMKFRIRLYKRFLDIIVSLISLSLGLPFLALFSKRKGVMINKLFNLLIGKMTLIGIYPLTGEAYEIWKPGFISMVHLNQSEILSDQLLQKLNEYYLQNVSLSLDSDIFIKYMLRKIGGNKIHT